MKKILFLLYTFGVTIMVVVTCAPSSKPAVLALSHITCKSNCSDEYRPICAVNALGVPRTFNNPCYLEAYYCNSRAYYVVMKEGEC